MSQILKSFRKRRIIKNRKRRSGRNLSDSDHLAFRARSAARQEKEAAYLQAKYIREKETVDLQAKYIREKADIIRKQLLPEYHRNRYTSATCLSDLTHELFARPVRWAITFVKPGEHDSMKTVLAHKLFNKYTVYYMGGSQALIRDRSEDYVLEFLVYCRLMYDELEGSADVYDRILRRECNEFPTKMQVK